MGRNCTVCAHPARAKIDAGLIAGISGAALGRLHGVGDDAISRHRGHIPKPPPVRNETPEQAAARGTDLLAQVRALHGKAISLLLAMEGAGDRRGATAAVRETLRCLEVMGRLTNQLGQGGDVTINVVSSPVFVSLQTTILTALEQFPDARAAVVAALSRSAAPMIEG
jgi:hypothetical protein